jgi:hypothetical protein
VLPPPLLLVPLLPHAAAASDRAASAEAPMIRRGRRAARLVPPTGFSLIWSHS